MNMTPASPSHDKELVPRKLLFLTLGLMLASLALVTTARLTDAPLSALPDMNAPIAAERLIILHGEMNGRATVLDQHGAVITRLAPDAGGFHRGEWSACWRGSAHSKACHMNFPSGSSALKAAVWR